MGDNTRVSPRLYTPESLKRNTQNELRKLQGQKKLWLPAAREWETDNLDRNSGIIRRRSLEF